MVTITDDEAITLGVLSGRGWTRPLLTVKLDDQEQMTAAAARGFRSFLVRGIVGPDGGWLVEGTAPTDSVPTGQPWLVGCRVDANGGLQSLGRRLEIFIAHEGGDALEVNYVYPGIVSVEVLDVSLIADVIEQYVDSSEGALTTLVFTTADGRKTGYQVTSNREVSGYALPGQRVEAAEPIEGRSLLSVVEAHRRA